MENEKLREVARSLVRPSMGILAADESASTMNKRLASISVEQTAEMRRIYRQLLFTTAGSEEYLSGIILYDSSIRNVTDDGTPFVDILLGRGIVPIIKVDKSTHPLTNFPGEVVTEGLDGLKERLLEYHDMGARAAKWRAVVKIGDGMPTDTAIHTNAIMLARYATLCQEAGIVPMVEPEVLFAGSHSVAQAEEVTTRTLRMLFETLAEFKVDFGGLILKTSMVLAGSEHPNQSSATEVADCTLRTLHNAVPKEVGGVVFLSGGQSVRRATENLQEIATRGEQPWGITYSYSRAIEEPILDAWQGDAANVPAAQAVLLHRLKMNSLARDGKYSPDLEG